MEKISFKDIFDFQKKSKIKAGDGFKLGEGKYPFFTSSDTLSKTLNEFLFEDESLIFGTGGLASIHHCNEKFAVSTDCFVTQPKNNNQVFSKYVYYYLSGNMHLLENGFKGAGLKHISKGYIEDLKIPLPNLPTQQKIATILDKADALRKYNKQLINKYDALTQSLFLDMFGDIDSDKKFPIGTIEDVIEIVRDGPHVSPKYSENGIPILSTRNIRPFELINEEIKYVSIETYTEMTKRFKPQKGDILLTKGGTTGFAKIVDWDWDFCIWVHLAALRVKKDVSPKYIESALNSYYGYNQSQEHTRGIANKDLGLKRMIKIKLPIPPIALQNQFAERVQLIETQKEQAQEALVKSELLFQGLLQQAFNGELN
ncbi:MAG: restriction endonuclease subunit S [Flavobacterium sp.]|nr:restriction endonuclease subunit S [Flavobacterium sp.]